MGLQEVAPLPWRSGFGLPAAVLTGDGVPCVSLNALFGLSRLAVWWLRLGIPVADIKPGNPQQRGLMRACT
jgi:putative transposase